MNLNREPLVKSGITTALVAAIIQLLVSFGLHITNDQQSAIHAIVGLVAPIAATLIVRDRVTPVDDPRGPGDEPLVPASTTTFLPGVEDA